MAENLVSPLIIDNGTGMIKAGSSGDKKPQVVIPSCVGHPKYVRYVPGGALENQNFFIGRVINEHRGAMRISYPMEHGIVTNWEDMERIWQYMYSRDGVNLPSDKHPVLLTEAPLNPLRNRELAAEIFFEHFNAPSMFFAPQAILSLYASGRTTGVVLDSGDGVTHAVPVYEGFALPHAITRIDIAGRDVTEYLQLLLRRAGLVFQTSAEKEIVKEIKEKYCYAAFDTSIEENKFQKYYNRTKTGLNLASQTTGLSNSLAMSGITNSNINTNIGGNTNVNDSIRRSPRENGYELPDGRIINIGPERFRAVEVLFHPELIGSEYYGIQHCLTNAIMRADMDMRKVLFSQIVLAGGSTMFDGFGNRLLKEVQNLSPPDLKIKVFAPPERQFSTWIGGSILASLAAFKTMCTTKAEYYEHGARILHQKSL